MGTTPPALPPSFQRAAKLCVACRHLKRTEANPVWWKCGHPGVPLDDLTTGEERTASYERKHGEACGRAGKLFEARDPFEAVVVEPAAPRAGWWLRVQWRLWRWVRG